MLLFLGLAFLACQNEGNSSEKTNQGVQLEDPFKDPVEDQSAAANQPDSVKVPTFTLDVSLSSAASKKLTDDKETIIFDIVFTGDPKNRQDPNISEDGMYTIGQYRRELPVGTTRITVRDAKVSGARLAGLRNDNYFVSVNTYSGRRSNKNNLLSVDYLYKDIETLAGKNIALNAKLITED